MQIIQVLFPVFAIVLLGYLYARKRSVDMSVANGLNMQVFLPALVFDVLSVGTFNVLQYGWLALAALVIVLGSGLLAMPVANLLGISKRVFVPPMMFNNCGNTGLPLALLAFGESGLHGFVVMFLISNLLHFTVGLAIAGGRISLVELLTNPVNLATLAGLIVNFMGVDIPTTVRLPISMIGEICIPLMLFSLGVRMVKVDPGEWRLGVLGGLLCPATGLLLAGCLYLFLPLDSHQLKLMVLFAALPPALLNFLFAERFSLEPERVAGIVLFGNAMAMLILSVVFLFIL